MAYPKRLIERSSGSFRFFFFIFLALALYVASFSPRADFIQRFVLEGISAVISLKQRLSGLVSLDRLYPEKTEAEVLRRENTLLRGYLVSASALRQENESLKQQLHFIKRHARHFISAPVLTQPRCGQAFLIGAGFKDGLQKNQAVLFAEGLVGRVGVVSAETSQVIPLTHMTSRVPVREVDQHSQAILIGEGTYALSLLRQKPGEKEESGALFVTSGFGGIFPDGIPVGRLDSTGTKVLPFFQTKNMTQVQVVQVGEKPLGALGKTEPEGALEQHPTNVALMNADSQKPAKTDPDPKDKKEASADPSTTNVNDIKE